jgi:hypothetical protein
MTIALGNAIGWVVEICLKKLGRMGMPLKCWCLPLTPDRVRADLMPLTTVPPNFRFAHVAAVQLSTRRPAHHGWSRRSSRSERRSASEKADVALCGAAERSRPTTTGQVASGNRQVSNRSGPNQPHWFLPSSATDRVREPICIFETTNVPARLS